MPVGEVTGSDLLALPNVTAESGAAGLTVTRLTTAESGAAGLTVTRLTRTAERLSSRRGRGGSQLERAKVPAKDTSVKQPPSVSSGTDDSSG